MTVLTTSPKLLVRLLITITLIVATPTVYSQKHDNTLVEEFSFALKDFKMDHQGEANNLNISISYRYAPNITKADYPDFRLLAKDVETLLNNYPNKDDYWELVNKRITSLLLQKYPAIVMVTSEIKVDPSRTVPYTRASRVTRERHVIKSKGKQVSGL
jgi:hypothetical protein